MEMPDVSSFEKYSAFWQNQVKKYGVDDQLNGVMNLLADLPGDDYFELGIGTGWPIANFLLAGGVQGIWM